MPYANPEDKKARDRRHYLLNSDKIKAKATAWQLANPEAYRARLKKWYSRRGRDLKYRSTFGISIDDYDAMLKAQGGCCNVCGTDKPSPKREHFAVDHCHVTGKVRGLLCIPCNSNLGWFERNAEKINQYLDKNND